MIGKKPGKLFVISGPSGSGKTTLAEKIIELLKRRIEKSISFTTRPKRIGERDKRDYFFISEEEFKHQLKAKKILEWTRYLEYYYGTPREFIDKRLKQGKHIVLCVDLKGAEKLRELYTRNIVTIFIMPPSFRELQNRIEKRCSKTDKQEVIRRLKLAEREVQAAGRFDYCLVNKDLGKTLQRLKKIISSEIEN